MVVVRVLQRKDAASLVVAIAAGLILANFVADVTGHLAAWLSGLDTDGSFKTDYWHPLVAFVVQLLALELVAWLVVTLRGEASKRG